MENLDELLKQFAELNFDDMEDVTGMNIKEDVSDENVQDDLADLAVLLRNVVEEIEDGEDKTAIEKAITVVDKYME